MRTLMAVLVFLITVLFSDCKKNHTGTTPPDYADSIKRQLWAFYKFDNASFADSSGNGRTMRGLNGIQFGADKNGLNNNALSFDGVNDYSVIDDGTSFPVGTFTVSFWMFAQKTTSGRIFNKGNFNDAKGVATTCGFDDDNQSNKLLFTINTDVNICTTPPANSSLVYLNSNVTLAQNVWYSITVAHINGVEKCYINGQLVAMGPTPIASFKNCLNAPFYFGIWWLGDMRAYMGRLDNVRIYTRELSNEEIKFISDSYR